MNSFIHDYPTLTPEQAAEQGYQSITSPYSPSEKDIFARAVADQGKTDYKVVVIRKSCLEIWRKAADLKELAKE